MTSEVVFSGLQRSTRIEFLAKCKARIMEAVSTQLDLELEKYVDIWEPPVIPPDVANSMTPAEIKERNEDYLQERVSMTTSDVMINVLENAFGIGRLGSSEGSVNETLYKADVYELTPDVTA
jgi:hypothetical protein